MYQAYQKSYTISMKFLSKTAVFKNQWVQVYAKKYRLTNGKEDDFFVIGDGHAVVSILAIDENNTVLLIQQYRWAIGAETINLPGGNVEDDEEPLAAAKRELTEETGFTAEKWQLLCKNYLDSGQKDCIHYIYLATLLEHQNSEQITENSEPIVLLKVDIEELANTIYDLNNITESALALGIAAYKFQITKS